MPSEPKTPGHSGTPQKSLTYLQGLRETLFSTEMFRRQEQFNQRREDLNSPTEQPRQRQEGGQFLIRGITRETFKIMRIRTQNAFLREGRLKSTNKSFSAELKEVHALQDGQHKTILFLLAQPRALRLPKAT